MAGDTLGKAHVDKTLGFSIKVPKDWDFVASHEKERYIVATFISKLRLRTTKQKDWKESGSHRPMMRIIAFTPENIDMGKDREEEEEIFGKKVKYTISRNPYKDYREYVRRTLTGFYFGEEEEAKIKGLSCTYLDVIMEQSRPPLRRVSCIYHLGDIDVAVFFEIMEEWYPKHKSLFAKAFKSFKKVKREEVESDLTEKSGSGKMTREEWVQSKVDSLPEGWTYKLSKHHLILSHTSKKYTGKVAKFADAIREKIEKDFGYKKPKKDKESATLPIVRICGSVGEFNAFIDTSRGNSSYNPDSGEVLAYDGTREGYDVEWVYSRVGRGILNQYIYGKYRLTRPDDWYLSGMSYYYSSFKLKGSGCKYMKDTWITGRLREAKKNGELNSFRTLMNHSGKGVRSIEDWWKVGTLACFLKSREGNKKPWKGLLDVYMGNFKSAYDEMSKEIEEMTGDIEAEDEEDAEEQAEERAEELRDLLKEFDKKVRKRTFEETFTRWEDSDWDKLEKAWEDWTI